jgi:hypothetical protein
MNALMRYDGYTSSDRVDDLLDKILRYGIGSITELEISFLDSYSVGGEEHIHNIIIKEESEKVFEDDDSNFRFEYSHTEIFGKEKHFIGTLYVPDMILNKRHKIEGILSGMIILFDGGITSPDFYHFIDNKTHYDVFEFCSRLEYELDMFIDYVIGEITNNDFESKV